MTGVSSDLWTIAYDGTKFDFLKNGTVFHTRAAAANLGLVVKHRAYTQGAVMRDLSFGPLPISAGTGSQIAGNTVTKTAASAWGNHVAYGDQAMTGAAMVQFRLDDPNMTGKNQQAGLATYANRAVAGTYWADGGFAAAIYFDELSNALMMFDGVDWIRTSVTGVSSDLWSISYDGTKFDFAKNGAVFHSRAAAANLRSSSSTARRPRGRSSAISASARPVAAGSPKSSTLRAMRPATPTIPTATC